jgi:hypothetical protein
VLVAARYLPQQHLIGPAWFAIYWFTLKRSFPFVVLAYVVTQVAAWFFQGGKGVDVGAAIGHFPSVALTFWAVVTLGFACFEYAQGRYFHKVDLSKGWNPNDLPKVEPAQGKRPSLAGGVADLIVSVVGMVWLLAIPYKPYLILGPLVGHLREMPFGLTPEWHIFYWQIISLLGVQLVLKTVMVFLHGAERWRRGFDMVVQVIGILIIAVMVQARTYMVPGTSVGAMSMKDLTTLNAAINFGFKVALVLSVVKLLWDVWKMIVSSRAEQKGFVTVL